MRRHPAWDKRIAVDWKWIIPPSSPSLTELVVFDRYLGQLPRAANVLILGSTPELRDLCFFHGLTATVVDYNPDTFRILGRYRRHPDVSRLVVQDWRTMAPDRAYDAVVGDLALNMVSVPEQALVMDNIARALAAGGLLIHRAWVRKGERYSPRSATLASIFEERASLRPNANCFYTLALPLIFHYFNGQEQSINVQDVLRGLEAACTEGLVGADCLDQFRQCWHRYLMPNWIQTSVDFETMMNQRLTTVAIEHGEDFYREFCPIYVMRRPIEAGKPIEPAAAQHREER
jgi:hypothetical protein